LRDSLRSRAFCKEEGLNLNVRASIGLATYPHDAKTPHDIIRKPDEMMFVVKNSNRDNIGIAQKGSGEVGVSCQPLAVRKSTVRRTALVFCRRLRYPPFENRKGWGSLH